MSRPILKENPELVHMLVELRKAARTHHAPVWKAVAEHLNRPRHQVEPINIGQLERIAAVDETVVIPGKLLAEGRLSKPLTVAAFQYSESARAKVHRAGGHALTIHELLRARPDGAGVRILA